MGNFKVEKTDGGTLITDGNMTETTAKNIKEDFKKTKDMSVNDSAKYALQKLKEETAAKKRYDDMTNTWIKNNKSMSREQKDIFLKEYIMLRDKYSFAKGGATMQQQMSLFQEGGLEQDGGTIDPVSGNDVPVGSSQEEVRDDIPAQLSEGEFVFPADVVRFIGLEKLMMMRQEAKAGLKRMEDMGQMGNSEEATMPDDVPFDINDLEMEDEPQEFQEGGSAGFRRVPERPSAGIPSIPENPIMPVQPSPNEEATFRNAPTEQPLSEDTGTTFESLLGESPETYDELRKYVGPNGEIRYIAFKDGLPLPAYAKILDNLVKTGYTYEDPAETSQEDEDVMDVGVETAQVRPDKENDTTSPQSMRKAEQERIQSFKSAIEAVMKETGYTAAEAAQYIKDGNHTIKGIKVPGFLFTSFNTLDGNEYNLEDAANAVQTNLDQLVPVSKPEIIPTDVGATSSTATQAEVAPITTEADVEKARTGEGVLTAQEQRKKAEAARAAELARMNLEGEAFSRVGKSILPSDKQESEDRKKQLIQDEQTAIEKQQELARKQLAAKQQRDSIRDADIAARDKQQKELDKDTREKIAETRRTGRITGFKEGGIASKKPKKKKVMKRGGLASKK